MSMSREFSFVRFVANTFLLLMALAMSLAAEATTGRARGEIVDTRLILLNRRCRFELEGKTGEIVSLQPGPVSLRGRWFEVVEEDRTGLAVWETWKRGRENVFASGPATVTQHGTGNAAMATMAWQRPKGLQIEAEVMLRDDDAGPCFRLRVTNRTGRALVDTIRMPVLRGIELGEGSDDWFTWPHTLGARFRVKGFAPGQRIEESYPDFLYMQWLDLFNQSRGVYLGCCDDYGYSKRLFIGREADGKSVMGIEFPGCWIARYGDTWTTPWVQIAAHRGDWHAGADLYRPFAEAAFGPLDPPERVREMPTAQCWLAHHASDADVGKLFEIQQQAPIHASFLMKSLNTSIPEGWDGFRGSALELHEAFQRIRELGGAPALFTFDRAPLMGRPNYAEHVSRWTCQRRDGSFVEAFRDMMPSPFAPDLVRARVGEAVRWVREFDLDEIHFDTAATTGAMAGPSYHAHFSQRPNEVPHYFKALYRAIRDGCRKYHPGFLLRAEHCADFFYPEFLTSTAHFFVTSDLVSQHNPPRDARMMPMLCRYTLPRHAALQMPSMSDNDFWTFGFGMGHGFHGGGPSWCFNPGVRQAESPPGEILHRYRFYDGEWRRYYDFRVGFEEAVVDADRSDIFAEAEIGGEWRLCDFPGPVIAVTHCSSGREVTLGQWYHQSHTVYFGERFVGKGRMEPRPIRLRVPTKLIDPQVRLFDERGESKPRYQLSHARVVVDIPDPTCFALELFTGPSVSLTVEELAHPGESTRLVVAVKQAHPRPLRGSIVLRLPAGWPEVNPILVPAKKEFTSTVLLLVPARIFGRNYPIKAVLQLGKLRRTTAVHLKVLEPLTVLYSFDVENGHGAGNLWCVDPGKRARLTVTCVNNTSMTTKVDVRVSGEQVSGQAAQRVEGISPRELGNPDTPLGRWTEGKGDATPNAMARTFAFDCTGAPSKPVKIQVMMNGRRAFETAVFPRTRIMDLNGEWKAHFTPVSRANVGGAERADNLDTEAVTPEVWDGGWKTILTPVHLSEEERRNYEWGIFRRLIYVPAEWQGADLWLRLSHTGAPWGAGGTLNIVYVNGWPAGRIGTSGECMLSSFLVFGGWNLIAVASHNPNSLVDPYLFVRDVPAPQRISPIAAAKRPEGAFILLAQRCTGQGITLPFIQGLPEGDHRRTDIAAGGENHFIYFAVAEAFRRELGNQLEVEVEYLDRGTSPFWLDYDSTDASAPINGAFKSTPPCNRTNTGEWKRRLFVLLDARFAHRQHLGSDFRLAANQDDLLVRRVEVRKRLAALP